MKKLLIISIVFIFLSTKGYSRPILPTHPPLSFPVLYTTFCSWFNFTHVDYYRKPIKK